MSVKGLVRATIVNLDQSGSQPIECLFNPKEYTVSKSNDWSVGETSGSNVPPMEFKGGRPATLSMDLYFDTTTTQEDVRKKHTEALWSLMLVDDKLKEPKSKMARPPHVRFQWGKTWAFDAVITSLNQAFSLFLADGTPVRAKVTVSFQQLKDAALLPPQNPTSRGDHAHRRWIVSPGDTLQLIAWREYHDTSKWRDIAEANGLTSLRDLPPGLELRIPNV